MTESSNQNSPAIDVKAAPANPSVSASSLPPELGRIVQQVLKKSGLWRSEKADVEAELAAHFADGLASGASPEQLAKDFGNPKAAAKLIRRGKFRNRPLWWRTLHRGSQVIFLGLGVAVLYTGFHVLRFYSGEPTIRFNPAELMNREGLAAPESARAWQIYRKAVLALDLNAEEQLKIGEVAVSAPSDADFAEIKPLLKRAQRTLDLTRAAAALPILGYKASHTGDHEINLHIWEVNGKKGQPPAPEPAEVAGENPDAIGIIFYHLGQLRQLARLLRADCYDAIREGDSQRLSSNITALLGMSVQARKPDSIICSFVAIAISNIAGDVLRETLAIRPDLLSDSTLRDLAHRFAALGAAPDFVSLKGERLFFDDFLQRAYTDDGNGDGRFTSAGALYLAQLGNYKEPMPPPVYAVSSIVVAGRKQLRDLYHGMLDRAGAEMQTPPWRLDTNSPRAGEELDRSISTPLARARYEAISLLLPALGHAYRIATNAVMERDATVASIAIELYRRRNGQLPASLDDLVPSLLPAIPLDNADGLPLRYHARDGSYILYSLGADGADAGGVAAANLKDQSALRGFGRQPQLSAPADWVFFPAEPLQKK